MKVANLTLPSEDYRIRKGLFGRVILQYKREVLRQRYGGIQNPPPNWFTEKQKEKWMEERYYKTYVWEDVKW